MIKPSTVLSAGIGSISALAGDVFIAKDVLTLFVDGFHSLFIGGLGALGGLIAKRAFEYYINKKKKTKI